MSGSSSRHPYGDSSSDLPFRAYHHSPPISDHDESDSEVEDHAQSLSRTEYRALIDLSESEVLMRRAPPRRVGSSSSIASMMCESAVGRSQVNWTRFDPTMHTSRNGTLQQNNDNTESTQTFRRGSDTWRIDYLQGPPMNIPSNPSIARTQDNISSTFSRGRSPTSILMRGERGRGGRGTDMYGRSSGRVSGSCMGGRGESSSSRGESTDRGSASPASRFGGRARGRGYRGY